QRCAGRLKILLLQPDRHELPEMLRCCPVDAARQQPAREIPQGDGDGDYVSVPGWPRGHMGQPTLVRLYAMRRQAEGQMVEQRGLARVRVPEQDQMAMLGNRLQRPQRTVLVLPPQTTFPPPLCIPASAWH